MSSWVLSPSALGLTHNSSTQSGVNQFATKVFHKILLSSKCNDFIHRAQVLNTQRVWNRRARPPTVVAAELLHKAFYTFMSLNVHATHAENERRNPRTLVIKDVNARWPGDSCTSWPKVPGSLLQGRSIAKEIYLEVVMLLKCLWWDRNGMSFGRRQKSCKWFDLSHKKTHPKNEFWAYLPFRWILLFFSDAQRSPKNVDLLNEDFKRKVSVYISHSF